MNFGVKNTNPEHGLREKNWVIIGQTTILAAKAEAGQTNTELSKWKNGKD